MEKWWKNSVFYQIYTRSFQDSDGDGIGDIQGIIQRLPYLKKLGINAIWLSPIFESPNVDNGYDISDYYQIMPTFGTMIDMEELIDTAKNMNIRIILDIVVNHTSDQHPWFKQALAGEEKYRNYYLFRKSETESAPNELESFFGGSAWTYLSNQKEYYFHLFAKEQPDLNWNNPELRQKIWDIMRFWRDKGVGGFRLDVIDLIGKDIDQLITGDGPKLHPYLHEMYENVLAGTDLVTIGETGSVTPETAPLYTRPERKELSMVFQFQHMALDEVPEKSKWHLRQMNISELKKVLSKWQTELPADAWNSLFWNNHDQPRILSRWGDPKYPLESGKMLAILLHMMRGTPFIYQGEEFGMLNQPITEIDQLDDIESIQFFTEHLQKGWSEELILKAINTKGRDNARTPIQWSKEKNAGFSTSKPWLAVNSNFKSINAESALADKNSLYYCYQKLIELRRDYPLIQNGNYKLLDTNDTIFAYTRSYKNETWMICANFSDNEQIFTLENEINKTIISNYQKDYAGKQLLLLSPYETFAVKLA